MALFQHCSVLFELKGLPFKEKKKIKLAVTDNGGKMSFVANKECSLIVTSDVSSLSPGRIRNIVKHQIPVVGLNYVHRCVEADCRLPVEDFKLDVSSTNDLPAACKDTKEKWSGSTVTSAPSKGQAKPLKTVRSTERAESPMEQGRVIENYRVYNETDSALPKFPESFQVAKYSLFQKSNGQSWCLLELQSAKSESGRKYRVVRYWMGDIQSKKAAVRDQMVFVSTSEEAVKVFQALSDSVKADGLKQKSHGPPQVTEMGSAPLQQLLLEEKLHTGALSTEVGQFVELLWQEALGCIDLILNTPIHKISLNDVTRAEGLLIQVQRKIMENKNDELSLKSQCVMLLNEYCTLLPQRSPVGPDMSSISKQFDLCQVIRDILNVSEMTLGSTVPSSVGKYRALRCSIEAVPKGCSEFEAVTSLLQHSKVQVHQILRVDRAPELQSFKRELGNIKPLLHSSRPHNFVGILSRGLLLPCVAVSQHGIQRTDAGDLGSGIYFSDEINTTLKYSHCSLTDGSRLVLVCDVALGRCKDFRKKDLTLTQAPEGHDSAHGVRNAPGLQSEFMDNEYVVYSPDQVKVKYVVRLSSQGDELKSFTPEIVQSDEPLSSPPDQGVTEIEDGIVDVKNPLDNVTAGLLNSSGQQIPLQAVHVKCKLVDLLAQVIIFQKYTNESSMPIEAKYVFPLDDSAAVCGFEAFINGKHVVGQVKEKETARREYKQAIEKGHGAYLMDQDAPDVFTISVGNLPPGATVLIKVTFVSELVVKDGSIFFSLPSSVAPWQESAALNQTTQVTVEKVCVTDEGASTREFNLDMSIEMPHQITEVKCVTHQVKLKKTDCKAVVSVLPGEVMGPEGFQLLVTLTEVHVPRMWVEQHPNKDSQACMLVFYPNFEAASSDKSDEVVLLLDASQSMKGESLNSARMIAQQILKTLDHNVSVNVIFFGTNHTEAFLSAKPIDEARLEAKNFIKHFSLAGGSTELWRPLRALSLLPPSSGTRNLLLLSDGHIQNTELTLQLLRDNAPHTRLFTCGLSPTANRHMLRALAQAGGGAYEFFDSKSKHTWSEKVASQVKRLQAPGASSVSVKWQQFNPTAPPPVQAPKQLHALFNDCHTLVFGFVPHCTKATLLGNLSGQEIETMVSTSELQKTKGTFLHKLTARAIIRDFEDGSLDSNAVLHEEKKAELKSFVIELSKEFSVLSQFTSFVAIEERESEEGKGFTDIPKLIAEEDVDFLPYMSWASTEDSDEEDIYDQISPGIEYGAAVMEDETWGSIPTFEETPDDFLMGDSISESLSTSDEDMGFGLTGFPSPPPRMEIDMICQKSSKIFPEPMDSLVSMEISEAISAPSRSRVLKNKNSLSAKIPIPPEHPLSVPVLMSPMSAPFAMLSPPPPPPPPSRPSALVETAEKGLRNDPCRLSPVEQDEDMAEGDVALVSVRRKRGLRTVFSAAPPPPPPPSLLRSTLTAGPLRRVVGKRLEMSPVSSAAAPVPMRLHRTCSSPDSPPPHFAFLKKSARLSAPHVLGSNARLSLLVAKQKSFSFGSMGSQFDQTPPPPPPPGLAAPPSISMSATSHLRAVRPTNGMRPLPVPNRQRTSPQSYSSAQTPSPFAQHAMAAPPAPDILQQQEVLADSYLSYPEAHSGLFGSAQRVMDLQREHAKRQSDQRRSVLSRSESPECGFSFGGFGGQAREGGFVGQLVGGDFEGQAGGSVFGGRAEGRSFVGRERENGFRVQLGGGDFEGQAGGSSVEGRVGGEGRFRAAVIKRAVPRDEEMESEATLHEETHKPSFLKGGLPKLRRKKFSEEIGDNISKWPEIFSLQNPEGYWELTPKLGMLLNCDVSRFADDFLRRKGIASLGEKAHADILKLLATLLVLQLMRLEKIMEGQLLRTLFCLEDNKFRSDHWEAVNRAVEWARWADRQYPCVYSRLEFGLSWDSSTKQLLGAERIHHCSPLTGLNLNPRPTMVL